MILWWLRWFVCVENWKVVVIKIIGKVLIDFYNYYYYVVVSVILGVDDFLNEFWECWN